MDDIVTLHNAGLRRPERRFRELGEVVLGSALSAALNDIAVEAIRKLATSFDRQIVGGPEPFTKIAPGPRKSSVVEKPGRFVSGEDTVKAAISVNPLQSTYLKYALGEKRERLPGDVGLAANVLLVPISSNLKRYQDIELRRGNLPKGAIKKLMKRVGEHASIASLAYRGG